MRTRLLACLAVALLPTAPLFAADDPFLACTFAATWPSGNVGNKAVALRFNTPLEGSKNPLSGVAFDTETLRFVAGWTDGAKFLNGKGVIFDGSHGTNPGPGGTQVVGTKPGPGWAKGTNLADPRTPKFGPLPREWAKYNGLYRHEDGTVFSYTVGGTAILDMMNAEVQGKTRIFTRTLNLKPSTAALTMVVADLDGATGEVKNKLAVLTGPKGVTAAKIIAAPEGTAFEVLDKSRIVLKIPATAADSKVKIALWGGPAADLATAGQALAATATPVDLTPLTKGGKAQWPTPLEAAGKRSPDTAAYVLDEIPVPAKNPYNSKIAVGGLDFFPDGKAAISTWHGDVWVGSGIDDKLEKVTWKRVASGLFHALGLKIVDGKIYVLGRDGITRLTDLNGDGEADFYEAFNHDVMVTPNFHEFAFELQTDPDGNFYFSKGGPVRPGGGGWDTISPHNGCLFKVSSDGSKFEVVARGFRAPNGISIGPKGEMTSGDNEGTWTPKCPLNWIKPGGFYGVPEMSGKDPKPTVRDNPLCWMPKDVDNSNGGQVWVSGEKFGPLSGQLLHMSYGTCKLYSVLKEEVGGQMQGGVVPLPLKFDSGICRARFRADENALYLVGLKGWQTTATKDGGFYRVRYTGKPANLPTALNAKAGELKITFSDQLEKKSAADPDNYTIEQWNYRWTAGYGSPHVKTDDPKKEGKDEVEIESAELSADGKTVTLKIPSLKPVMQMKINIKVKAADGSEVKHVIHNSLNVVGTQRGEIHPGAFKIVDGK